MFAEIPLFQYATGSPWHAASRTWCFQSVVDRWLEELIAVGFDCPDVITAQDPLSRSRLPVALAQLTAASRQIANNLFICACNDGNSHPAADHYGTADCGLDAATVRLGDAKCPVSSALQGWQQRSCLHLLMWLQRRNRPIPFEPAQSLWHLPRTSKLPQMIRWSNLPIAQCAYL